MRYKNMIRLLIILLLIIGAGGCSRNAGALKPVSPAGAVQANITVEGDTYPLKIKDFLGQETVLKQKPLRAAVLSGTPLNIWYDLGGKSVCTSDISGSLKLIPAYQEEIEKLPKVGAVYAIDLEAVIAQKPDLIISQYGPQTTQAIRQREMGFPVICTQTKTYEDVLQTYRVFGKILGAEDKAEVAVRKLEEQKKAILDKLPAEGKTIVILYVTSNSLAVKLDNSIAGDIAKMLKLKNIASDLPPDTIGSENTPLDIEYIVEKNPDYVLVTSMIDSNEAAKKAMEAEFAGNPVWKGVKAAAEGRVLYLPQQYFLYNAGPYYAEAIDYMARGIYPEIYGSLEDWHE